MGMRKGEKKCRQEILVEYLDGNLEPVAERQLEGHILDCPACRQNIEVLTATLSLADAASTPESNLLYSSSFLYRVRQGIEERESTSGFFTWRTGLLGALSLAAFFIWMFARADTLSDGEDILSLPFPEVQTLESQAEIAEIVDNYWLETASTDELLSEVGSISGEEYMALLEVH
jgi:hypothetical protein